MTKSIFRCTSLGSEIQDSLHWHEETHFPQKVFNAHCTDAKTVPIHLLCLHQKTHFKIFSFPEQQSNSSNLQQQQLLQGITELAECGPLLFQHFCIAMQISIFILQWLLNNYTSRSSCKGYNFNIAVSYHFTQPFYSWAETL